MKVKYVHTNIVANDWENLTRFYIDVFGCEPVYPKRDLSGQWIEKLTNIENVHIRGIHIRLPGYVDGPTLEIFEYNQTTEKGIPAAINKPGFAHIAFLVESVDDFNQKLLENGGSTVGELVEKEIDGVGILTVIYARDPEGNIIELQNWK